MKKKLTKAEMRIAIAKDVLAQIKANKYIPTHSVWIREEGNKTYDKWLLENAMSCEINVQKYTKNIKKCSVCAVGSLFVSAVNKYNNVYGDIYNMSSDTVFDTSNRGNKSPLLRYFTINQIRLIEHTFEGGCGAVCLDDEYKELTKKSYAFYRQYPDDKDRLIAIMKNIIENKGTFKP